MLVLAMEFSRVEAVSMLGSQASPSPQRTPPAEGQRGHEEQPSLRDRSLKTEQKSPTPSLERQEDKSYDNRSIE
jgi:hypothetical protein